MSNESQQQEKQKQANLTGGSTTLEQKRSFRRFWRFLQFFFFWSFQPYYKLDIVPSCNPVQYQGKLMMQT